MRLPTSSRYWNEDEGRAVVEAWRESGEPAPAFARRHGLRPERLLYWGRRLAPGRTAPTRSLALVPATVIDEAAAPVTIRLPNGVGIEAPSATPAWIAAVIAELARSS
jgi:hypothetical protein